MGLSKKSQYTVAKILHWIAAFFIAFNMLSGWKIAGFELEAKQLFMMLHSSFGTMVLLLMLLRWWWRRKNKLYVPPRWYKRPSMLVQWIFYPLLTIQPIIVIAQAAFIDYDVKAFGFINYASLAQADAVIRENLLAIHSAIALTAIILVLLHALERSRQVFIDDSSFRADEAEKEGITQ